MTDPFVTADWLASNLDTVVVLDATYYLPSDPARSRADWEAARIPGARLFEIDTVADPESDLPHMLPTEAGFAVAMAALGIDGTKPVVVYDRSTNHFSAPRVWYTLRLFGLEKVFVLDGGMTSWTGGGHATEQGAASPYETVPQRTWKLRRSQVISGPDMAVRVATGGEVIIDARSQDRFDGTAPEPRPGLKSGHMPGATCLPFGTLTGPDGLFLGRAELKALFGNRAACDPILSCGSGMTACVLALGLARIGVTGRLFDGSWAEWGQGTLGPIETIG
ncbi:sulfurtransferase [Pseudooceanicola nitratireducens]|uniref:sulfurtransferase n=1 Tax=Pseudooceanicola nitratireducens TaxID=517719 RepID=UPI00351257B5